MTFIIASGVGSTFDTNVVTGVDGLLKAYSENFTASKVTLDWLGMTGSYDAQGVFYADTIFAFNGEAVSSGTLFFPYNVSECDPWGNLYRYEGAYLNGTKTNWPVYLDTETEIVRGFYNFTVEKDGSYTLEPVDYKYGWATVRHMNEKYWIDVTNGADGYDASNAVVVDLRVGAALEEVDSIADLSDLYYDNYNDYHNYKVKLAFTVSGNNVGVIYVLDAGFENATLVKLSDTLGLTLAGTLLGTMASISAPPSTSTCTTITSPLLASTLLISTVALPRVRWSPSMSMMMA